MTVEIIGQFRFLLLALCLGMAYICGYDILRFFRWLFPHGKILLWLGDILYWSIVSVPGFYVFFLYNDGIIRWYGVTSVISGGLLYEFGISRPVRKIGDRLFSAKKRMLFLKIFRFRKKLKENLTEKVEKILKKCKKRLQKSPK